MALPSIPRLLPAINNLKTSANSLLDKATTVIGVIGAGACLASTLSTGTLKAAAGGALKAAAGGLLGSAAALAKAAKDAIEGAIVDAINKITGKILGPLRALKKLFNDVSELVDTLKDIKSTISQRARDLKKANKEKKNCETMMANMMGCLMKKATAGLTKKIMANVNKSFDKVVGNITQKIQLGGNVFEGPINKYKGQLNKAATQMEKINKMSMNFKK
jgi:hypothetical protein